MPESIFGATLPRSLHSPQVATAARPPLRVVWLVARRSWWLAPVAPPAPAVSMSAAGIYCRKVLTRKTMKKQWFCLFFDEKSWFGEVFSQQNLDSERFLPLYLLSWRRNIISDIINTFLRFPENIIQFHPWFFANLIFLSSSGNFQTSSRFV